MGRWDSKLTHGLQPLTQAQPVEITNLCKLTTSPGADRNYGDSTPIFKLKTQEVPRPQNIWC